MHSCSVCVCVCLNTYQAVYSQFISFILCKLYLNKVKIFIVELKCCHTLSFVYSTSATLLPAQYLFCLLPNQQLSAYPESWSHPSLKQLINAIHPYQCTALKTYSFKNEHVLIILTKGGPLLCSFLESFYYLLNIHQKCIILKYLCIF